MNDTIFHATSFQSASNFLEYNGIKTSDLLLNPQELEVTKQITPKQYLYYTSFARSLTSFLNLAHPNNIKHWHLIRLYAKQHNLTIKDLYKKLYEYKSLVREQYNPC